MPWLWICNTHIAKFMWVLCYVFIFNLSFSILIKSCFKKLIFKILHDFFKCPSNEWSHYLKYGICTLAIKRIKLLTTVKIIYLYQIIKFIYSIRNITNYLRRIIFTRAHSFTNFSQKRKRGHKKNFLKITLRNNPLPY
jgi:hypothetical protein